MTIDFIVNYPVVVILVLYEYVNLKSYEKQPVFKKSCYKIFHALSRCMFIEFEKDESVFWKQQQQLTR
jgi:hypothetical protein